MSYFASVIVCFFIYMCCMLFQHGSRFVNQGAVVGMAIIAAIPYVNLFVAVLLVIDALKILYNDVLNAFKDTPSC